MYEFRAYSSQLFPRPSSLMAWYRPAFLQSSMTAGLDALSCPTHRFSLWLMPVVTPPTLIAVNLVSCRHVHLVSVCLLCLCSMRRPASMCRVSALPLYGPLRVSCKAMMVTPMRSASAPKNCTASGCCDGCPSMFSCISVSHESFTGLGCMSIEILNSYSQAATCRFYAFSFRCRRLGLGVSPMGVPR